MFKYILLNIVHLFQMVADLLQEDVLIRKFMATWYLPGSSIVIGIGYPPDRRRYGAFYMDREAALSSKMQTGTKSTSNGKRVL